MPRTGGGMNTSACASSIWASLPRSSCAILSIVWPLLVALLEVVEHQEQQAGVGGGREGRARCGPVKALEYLTPGVGQHDVGRLLHHRIGARQRCARRQLQRDDQDGAVEAGDEAGRQALHEPAGERQQQHVADQHRHPGARQAAHQPAVAARHAHRSRGRTRGRRHAPAASAATTCACPSPCGLNSSAHSAGLSVSDRNSEMAVAVAMVTANCR